MSQSLMIHQLSIDALKKIFEEVDYDDRFTSLGGFAGTIDMYSLLLTCKVFKKVVIHYHIYNAFLSVKKVYHVNTRCRELFKKREKAARVITL